MKHEQTHIEKNADFFEGDIRTIAKNNDLFKRVIYTGPRCQLAVMSIPAGDDSGEEVHANVDEILVVVDGKGEATLNGRMQSVEKHGVIFATAGTHCNVRNPGRKALKLMIVYAPPAYADSTVDHTKAEALYDEHA